MQIPPTQGMLNREITDTSTAECDQWPANVAAHVDHGSDQSSECTCSPLESAPLIQGCHGSSQKSHANNRASIPSHTARQWVHCLNAHMFCNLLLCTAGPRGGCLLCCCCIFCLSPKSIANGRLLILIINQTGGRCVAVVSEGVYPEFCEDGGGSKYVLRCCCSRLVRVEMDGSENCLYFGIMVLLLCSSVRGGRVLLL